MELADLTHTFFAFAVVLAMIWAFSVAVRKFGLDKKLRGVTGGQGRLQVCEVLYLDARRKLTLVRADNREYVLLLSQDTVTVIDTKDVTHEPVA